MSKTLEIKRLSLEQKEMLCRTALDTCKVSVKNLLSYYHLKPSYVPSPDAEAVRNAINSILDDMEDDMTADKLLWYIPSSLAEDNLHYIAVRLVAICYIAACSDYKFLGFYEGDIEAFNEQLRNGKKTNGGWMDPVNVSDMMYKYKTYPRVCYLDGTVLWEKDYSEYDKSHPEAYIPESLRRYLNKFDNNIDLFKETLRLVSLCSIEQRKGDIRQAVIDNWILLNKE